MFGLNIIISCNQPMEPCIAVGYVIIIYCDYYMLVDGRENKTGQFGKSMFPPEINPTFIFLHRMIGHVYGVFHIG